MEEIIKRNEERERDHLSAKRLLNNNSGPQHCCAHGQTPSYDLFYGWDMHILYPLEDSFDWEGYRLAHYSGGLRTHQYYNLSPAVVDLLIKGEKRNRLSSENMKRDRKRVYFFFLFPPPFYPEIFKRNRDAFFHRVSSISKSWEKSFGWRSYCTLERGAEENLIGSTVGIHKFALGWNWKIHELPNLILLHPFSLLHNNFVLFRSIGENRLASGTDAAFCPCKSLFFFFHGATGNKNRIYKMNKFHTIGARANRQLHREKKNKE